MHFCYHEFLGRLTHFLKSTLSIGSLIILFLCVLALPVPNVLAVTRTWSPAGVNSYWSTANNWSPAGTTSASDTAVIGAGGNPYVDVASSIGTISASGTSTNHSIISGSSNTLTIGRGTSGSTGITGGYLDFSTNMQIALNNNQVWNATNIAFLFSGGSGSPFDLKNFTLTIGNGSAATNADLTGAAISGTGGITVSNGSTLSLGINQSTFTGSINNSFTGNLTINSGGTLIYGGTSNPGGSGALGSGTIVLNSGSTIKPGYGSSGTSTYIYNPLTMNGTINLTPSAYTTFYGNVTLLGNTTIVVNTSSLGNNTLFSGNISGASRSLTISGSGEIDLNGQSTYTGGTTVNAGAILAIASSSTGNITSGPIGTGTLTLNGGRIYGPSNPTIANNISLSSGVTSYFGDVYGGDAGMTLSGIISGGSTATLVKIGGATYTFSGSSANTFAGNLTIDGGTIVFNKSAGVNAIGSGTNSLITINSSGTLKLGAASQIPTGVKMVLNGGTFNTNGYSVTTSNSALGTLTLSANSTINLGSGATILKYANSSAVSWTSGAALNIVNWTGTPVTGGGTDQVFFGSSTAGLTSTQLSQIYFINPNGLAAGKYSAIMLSTGEIIPGALVVPEPGTLLAAMTLSGIALSFELRRRQKNKKEPQPSAE